MALKPSKPQLTAFGSGGLELAERCRLSAVLQCSDPEPPGPWIWWGIFIHRFLEYGKTLGRDKALAYIAQKYPRAMKCCSHIDLRAIPDGDCEVGYGHRPAAGTVRRISWPDRGDPATEVYGKADLAVRAELHVADYKTGGRTSDPRLSSQVVSLAVARRIETRAAGLPGKVSIVGVRSDGALLWRTEQLSSGELDDHEGRLRTVHLRVLTDRAALARAGELPPAQPGPHCWSEWCPHAESCASAEPRPA